MFHHQALIFGIDEDGHEVLMKYNDLPDLGGLSTISNLRGANYGESDKGATNEDCANIQLVRKGYQPIGGISR